MKQKQKRALYFSHMFEIIVPTLSSSSTSIQSAPFVLGRLRDSGPGESTGGLVGMSHNPLDLTRYFC